MGGGVTIPRPPKGKWNTAGQIVGDGFSIAWRVLDAQYWGVPQRRRRIYLVADFRGQRAGEILFERKGLRGYFKTGGTPWQGTAGDAANRTGADDCEGECVAYSIGNGQLNQISMSEQSNTLDCMHDKQAVIVFDKEVYNSGANATGGHYMAEDGPAPSLRTGQPPGVCVRYIVRRLTPTECARLQGFPDNWGHPDHKDSFTLEELSFWKTVRDTYAAINGKSRKDYTEAQMLKWYNSLHTDSTEYKMWGNGIALPTALYVMQGISDALNELN